MLLRTYLCTFTLLLTSCFASGQTYRAWVSAGDEAFEKRRYAEAISHYFKAAEFEVDDAAVTFRTAEALRNYNDYERAAAWYTKVVMGDKENEYPLALFYLAEMRKFMGQYPESKLLFEKYTALNKTDTAGFVRKAEFEAAHMNTASAISDSLSDRKVSSAGSPINSVYSDFAGTFADDTTYYYSSLRYLFENTEKRSEGYYVTRILKTPLPGGSPLPLGMSINLPEAHNSNFSISPDNKFAVFTRCPENGDYRLRCELYETRFENGTWTRPERIQGKVNLEGTTTTQPAIAARGADGYVVYFVSDRQGGNGKLDIWKSNRTTSGVYEEPVNVGVPVNTFDDEVTPFFDSRQQTLYFSSYGHPGMGGYDVYRSNWNGSGFNEPSNLLPPVNSSANDIYFSLAADTLKGSLSSNRKGSMYISSQTCCYDIYFFKTEEKKVEEKEPEVIAVVEKVPEDLRQRKSYDDFLPLVLYFENDQPDPRTRQSTTKSDYLTLYNAYIDNRPDYLQQFTKGLSGEEKQQAADRIEAFFDDHVIASFERLEGFCGKLERAMKDSIKLTLEVRGRASPLAKTDYNEILSSRRISSLHNYLMKYNGGVLKPYIDSGQLIVKEVPAGESLAKTGISDELRDKRNSIYNPDAAIERRIELINVVIEPPAK